jgi:hypothetical protein
MGFLYVFGFVICIVLVIFVVGLGLIIMYDPLRAADQLKNEDDEGFYNDDYGMFI